MILANELCFSFQSNSWSSELHSIIYYYFFAKNVGVDVNDLSYSKRKCCRMEIKKHSRCTLQEIVRKRFGPYASLNLCILASQQPQFFCDCISHFTRKYFQRKSSYQNKTHNSIKYLFFSKI